MQAAAWLVGYGDWLFYKWEWTFLIFPLVGALCGIIVYDLLIAAQHTPLDTGASSNINAATSQTAATHKDVRVPTHCNSDAEVDSDGAVPSGYVASGVGLDELSLRPADAHFVSVAVTAPHSIALPLPLSLRAEEQETRGPQRLGSGSAANLPEPCASPSPPGRPSAFGRSSFNSQSERGVGDDNPALTLPTSHWLSTVEALKAVLLREPQ